MSRLVIAHPLLSATILLLALGAIPTLVFALQPETHAGRRATKIDPRYATQSGSLYRTRRQQVEVQNQEQRDSALETCAGLGLGPLASHYHLPPDPARVARRFSLEYERAYRHRAYTGCLHGLKEGG